MYSSIKKEPVFDDGIHVNEQNPQPGTSEGFLVTMVKKETDANHGHENNTQPIPLDRYLKPFLKYELDLDGVKQELLEKIYGCDGPSSWTEYSTTSWKTEAPYHDNVVTTFINYNGFQNGDHDTYSAQPGTSKSYLEPLLKEEFDVSCVKEELTQLNSDCDVPPVLRDCSTTQWKLQAPNDDNVATSSKENEKIQHINLVSPPADTAPQLFCKEYGKCFEKKSVVLRHCITTHDRRSYSCLLCKKRFTNISYLKNHAMSHAGNNVFPCHQCHMSFKRKDYLLAHSKIHTGERPFPCLLCEKSFSQKSSLKTHSRIHTGEGPFPCLQCEKSFSQKSSLKAHSRIHTGERPFPCLQCEKSFSQKSSLITHSRIHTGERPFPCLQCEKKFNQKCNLIKHSRIHTGEKPFPFSSAKRVLVYFS